MSNKNFKFRIITSKTVHDTIFTNPKKILEIVKETYIQHFNGETVNPPSSFLNFPENSTERIISLPAYIGGNKKISGLKWIASYPSNIKNNIPRASAIVVLNEPNTGYPLACLEGSVISAARTAASAVLAAYYIKQQKPTISCLGIVGTGLIASYVLEFFMQANWNIEQICLYDIHNDYAQKFFTEQNQIKNCKVRIGKTLEEVLQSSDMIVLATTASTPHILNPNIFKHKPTILNLSLRDLSHEIITDSYNIVDDVQHVLKANTSLDLTEKEHGHHNFIDNTLPDILANSKEIVTSKTIIFSPFGLGILDLAIGYYIYEIAIQNGSSIKIENFFQKQYEVNIIIMIIDKKLLVNNRQHKQISSTFTTMLNNFDWYNNFISQSKFNTTKLFSDLPWIDNKILNKFYYDISNKNITDGSQYLTSGTTTGLRKKIFYSKADEQNYIEQRFHIFKNFIGNKVKSAAADLGTGHAAASASIIFSKLGLKSITIDHTDPIEKHIKALNSFNPDVLFTMPVILDKLIGNGELNIKPKKIIVVGDIASVSWKVHISNFFRIGFHDILDIFGSIEIGSIAYQCHNCNLYHFGHNIIPEMINLDKNLGVLAVTSLSRSYFPAIRYITDDVISGFQKIWCKRKKFFAFEKILGRQGNEIKHGEKISNYELNEVIQCYFPGALYECYSDKELKINIYHKDFDSKAISNIKRDLKKINPTLGTMIDSHLVNDIEIKCFSDPSLLVRHHKRIFNRICNY